MHVYMQSIAAVVTAISFHLLYLLKYSKLLQKWIADMQNCKSTLSVQTPWDDPRCCVLYPLCVGTEVKLMGCSWPVAKCGRETKADPFFTW